MEQETVNTPEMMNKEDADSTGKALSSKSKAKEIPRYLRPSTGSCHDFCKYGKKQAPVEKPWRSTTKKLFKKDPSDASSENLKPNKLMEAREKKVSHGSSEITNKEVVKYQVSGVSSRLKQEALMISPGDETPVKQTNKKTTISSKIKPSPDSGSRSSGSVDALKKKVLKKSVSALPTSKSKVNSQQVASPVLKPRMGAKAGGKEDDAMIKKATVLSRVASKKVALTPRASLSPRLSLRLAGNSSLRKSQSAKAASSSSSRPNQKLRRVNHADESKEVDGYPVEEKTLHVVEMETTNKVLLEDDQNQQCFIEPSPPLPSTLSTQGDDECTVSEAEDYEYPSGSNETESIEEEIEMSNGEKKPRARNERESSDEATRELQFRRGKVVDVETVEDSARRLKFRKGRGLGDEKAEDVQVRRSFKKREDTEEGEEEDDGEKVVLRHQDVQERDAQGLLNNVIEETASKLVEARKSKVKALVGAFETVISLQESKPPANSEIGHLE